MRETLLGRRPAAHNAHIILGPFHTYGGKWKLRAGGARAARCALEPAARKLPRRACPAIAFVPAAKLGGKLPRLAQRARGCRRLVAILPGAAEAAVRQAREARDAALCAQRAGRWRPRAAGAVVARGAKVCPCAGRARGAKVALEAEPRAVLVCVHRGAVPVAPLLARAEAKRGREGEALVKFPAIVARLAAASALGSAAAS